MSDQKKKVNKQIDEKYITYRPYSSCFGDAGITKQTYAEYGEAETQAQKTAHSTGEEILIYQAIASADPDIKSKVKVAKLT